MRVKKLFTYTFTQFTYTFSTSCLFSVKITPVKPATIITFKLSPLYFRSNYLSRGTKWREEWNKCSWFRTLCRFRKPQHTCLFSAFSLLSSHDGLQTISQGLLVLCQPVNHGCRRKLLSTEAKRHKAAAACVRKLLAFKSPWLRASCRWRALPGAPQPPLCAAGLPGTFQSPRTYG